MGYWDGYRDGIRRNRGIGGTGIGITTAFVIAFMVLKLTNQIQWAWIWVFAPWWLPCCGVFSVFLVCAVLGITWVAVTSNPKKKENEMEFGKKFGDTGNKVIAIDESKFHEEEPVVEEVSEESVEELVEVVSGHGFGYKLWNSLRQHPRYSDWNCTEEIKWKEVDGIQRRC